jgi:hypothetical protein
MSADIMTLFTFLEYTTVKDLINALSGNSFQHTPYTNGGTCVFYVVTSSTIHTVFSIKSVPRLYSGSLFVALVVPVQCRAVESTRTRMEHVLSEL